MLTKEDLEAIGQLMDQKMDLRFAEQADLIQAGFADVYRRFDLVDFEFADVRREMRTGFAEVNARVDRLYELVDRDTKRLDDHETELLEHRNRMDRLEQHFMPKN